MAKAPKAFEPNLAEREMPDLEKLTYPIFASPKMDGIRACRIDEKQESAGFSLVNKRLVSRMLIDLPNPFLMAALQDTPAGLDGELCAAEPWDENLMSKTTSAIMSGKNAKEDVPWTYRVFDLWNLGDVPFLERLGWLQNILTDMGEHPRVKYHGGILCHSPEEILAFEDEQLELGYEGLIIRGAHSLYKFGRSTMKEQGLMKIKRFVDDEAEILSVHPMQHNGNEAGVDEKGRTKRSKAKGGMVELDTFGYFTCRDKDGVVFDVGGGKGITAAKRKEFWKHRETLPGEYLKFSHFPRGRVNKPRKPKIKEILGIRWKGDV